MPESTAPADWQQRIEALGGRRSEASIAAGVVVVLVFGALGLWTRGRPPVIAPPARAAPSPVTSSPAVSLMVHVAGAVKHPGVVEMPVGARVGDAIDAAGGALLGADLDLLNLAALLTDGAQVLVPRRGQRATVVAPAPGMTQSALIDLNLAEQSLLETVPGIGPVKAAAIVQYRTESGPFASLDELLEVAGIGPATLEAIRPYLSV
jgi:competence protein ComEA